MTATVTTPGGYGSSVPFTSIGTVGWDPNYVPLLPNGRPSVSLDGLVPTALNIVTANQGFGQGVCVSPTFGIAAGVVYWEIGWADVDGNLNGGIGLCLTPPRINPGPNGSEALANFYNALTVDGSNGFILRPDGRVRWGSAPPGPPPDFQYMPDQIANDVIGIGIDSTVFDSFWEITLFGIRNNASLAVAGNFTVPKGVVVPCIVFDSAPVSSVNVAVANFGLNGPTSFLGPGVFGSGPGDPFDPAQGITMGWPNSL